MTNNARMWNKMLMNGAKFHLFILLKLLSVPLVSPNEIAASPIKKYNYLPASQINLNEQSRVPFIPNGYLPAVVEWQFLPVVGTGMTWQVETDAVKDPAEGPVKEENHGELINIRMQIRNVYLTQLTWVLPAAIHPTLPITLCYNIGNNTRWDRVFPFHLAGNGEKANGML